MKLDFYCLNLCAVYSGKKEGEMNGGDEVVAAPAGPSPPLDWKFSQVFGERTAGEEVQEGIAFDYIFFFVLGLDPIGAL